MNFQKRIEKESYNVDYDINYPFTTAQNAYVLGAQFAASLIVEMAKKEANENGPWSNDVGLFLEWLESNIRGDE